MIKPYDQVVYVPDGTSEYEGISNSMERGFVTSIRGNYAFVRFWSGDIPGMNLRTKDNSERCSIGNLRIHRSTTEERIEYAIECHNIIMEENKDE